MMRNLEFPYHQTIYEHLHALYTARYNAVLERLLYPGEEPPFTLAADAAHSEALFYKVTDDGTSRTPSEHSVLETDLGKILGVRALKKAEPAKRPAPELPTPEKDLKTLDFFDRISQQEPDNTALQLQTLLAYGIVGARNKPSNERIEDVLRSRQPVTSPENKAFRKAVKFITRPLVSIDEEKVLERNIPKFKEQLDQRRNIDKNVANLNRYHMSRLARRIHELLLRPVTTRRDTIDEVDFQQDLVKPLPPLPPDPARRPLVVKLPWPLLPRGEGPTREPVERAPRVNTGCWRGRLDPLRIEWLELLARKWPHDGIVLEVDLQENSRTKDNGYQAAVLFEPDGKNPFAIVADSDVAFPENRLLVGIVQRLMNVQTGEPADWMEVFSQSKGVAYKAGAAGFNHGGYDFHGRVLEYLGEAYRQRYGPKAYLSLGVCLGLKIERSGIDAEMPPVRRGVIFE